MTPLTPEQIDFAKTCFATYLRVLQNSPAHNPHPRGVDVEHSALIRWLLAGNKPLPEPPPLRYSYPCYDLGLGKPVEIQELWERDDYVVIDQNSAWEWVDKGKGILKHRLTGHHYRYWQEQVTKEFHTSLGPKVETYLAKMLQRIVDASQTEEKEEKG